MLVCGAFLLLTSVVVTENAVANTGFSRLQLFLVPAVTILAGITAMRAGGKARIERPSRALLVATTAFGLLLCWAAASLPLVQHWVSQSIEDPKALVPVPLAYLVSPLLTAGLTCLLAVLAVNLAPPTQLFELLWLFAIAGAACTPVATVLNSTNVELYGRLATRLGGAAVIHTSLLLGLAICLAAFLHGHRRVISGLASLAYLGYFLATGARAGLISLGIFLALVIVPPLIHSARQRPTRLPLIVGGVIVGLIGFIGITKRILLNRGLDITGGGRVETWTYGLSQAFASLGNLVFGVGYGVLWPWYAFEAMVLPQPGAHGDKQMPEGITLSHAHNLYVAVLSEQGLVGIALLLVVLGTVLWAWWQARGVVERTIASGLVGTLAGFAFDTYLTKNFPVSFIWWVTLAGLLTMMSHRRRHERQPMTVLPHTVMLGH